MEASELISPVNQSKMREMNRGDVGGPKFGNHGNRRYADKKALETAAITGVSREIHDDHFGWAQKQRRKESALHYHGRTERLKRAKVTSML